MSDDIIERIAVVEESSKSAHKRLDGHSVEIVKLRDAKHDIYEKIHTHAGVIVGMENAVKALNESVNTWSDKTEKNTKTIDRASWVIMGGVAVGATLLTGVLYILKQLMGML